MLTKKLKTKYMDANCAFMFGCYANNDTALRLFDAETREPLMTVSTNLQEYGITPTNDWHFYIKDYSENQGILIALLDAELIEKTENEFYNGRVMFYEVKMIGELLNAYREQNNGE